MATDVDGTLLSSDQQLLPRVQQAVQRSVELGVPVRFVTATSESPYLEFVCGAIRMLALMPSLLGSIAP